MLYRNLKYFFWSTMMLITCFPLWAFQAVTFDRNSPIQIQSDRVSVEQMNQIAIYEGNVILIQGNHELRADKITIQQDKEGRLNVITAIGKPAAFNRPSLSC